ncbi:MAG: hypothetical protein ACRYFS_00125 [Janthinobacterium lividum]
MNLDRYKTLCLYAFRHGVSLRAQTPNAPQNTKVLFDSGMLYLTAILGDDPEFLKQITSLNLPDDVALALGSKFPSFDAKSYLTARAEARRLEEKLKAKKPFGAAA